MTKKREHRQCSFAEEGEKWSFIHDQVAVDIQVVAIQLEKKKISIEAAVKELRSLTQILEEQWECEQTEKNSQ